MAERILIVDDELDMLLLLKLILTEKTPHEIVTTPNPLEVEPLFKEKGFQLVITDLSMPGMNGIELIDVIKQLDPLVPVIIITAYGSIESAIDATKKGAFDFITKPFRKEQIILTIEKALEFRRIQTENIKLKEGGIGGSWFDAEAGDLTYDRAKERALAQFNRHYAKKLLERHQGDLAKAAQEAGWSEGELRRLLEAG
jgi:DNA-binding NtrC family response regulator